MRNALDNIASVHTRKLQTLTRLLSRAQSSSSAQIHALQAQLSLLRSSSSTIGLPESISGGVGTAGDLCICGGRRRSGYWSGYAGDEDPGADEDDGDLAGALEDGAGSFDEARVRRALRGMARTERMRLWVLWSLYTRIHLTSKNTQDWCDS